MVAQHTWFSGLDDGTVKVLFIFAAMAFVAVVWVISTAWRRARESDNRAQLTAMLIQRGMSADEIEKVLRAGVGSAEESDAAQKSDEPDDEVRLIKQLADLSYDGGDVEKILAAARVNGRLDAPTARIVEGLANNWMDADDIVRVLRARPSLSGGPLDPEKFGDALREKGFSQKQIELVLSTAA